MNKPLIEKRVQIDEYHINDYHYNEVDVAQAIKDFMMDCSEKLESNELEIVERNKNKHFGEFKGVN